MSNTTNDPSPPYGEKRDPMFDVDTIVDDDPDYDLSTSDGWQTTFHRKALVKVANAYENAIDRGDLIRRDELMKWLDIEIAMAETNLEEADRHHMMVPVTVARTMLATYKAVKAHIEG